YAWPEVSPAQRRAEALEKQILELCGHINAANALFLTLVAEFDREGYWHGVGMANCAQWLNLRCGLGMEAARERVRVARALQGLPLISASFSCGEISYSKVRAMTRVATPENEETLLNVALYGTATHVERLVRKYRRFERLEASAEAQERYRQRYVRYRYDEDGSLLIEAKLPPEIGELVKKALEAAVEVLYQDSRRLAREEAAATKTAANEEEKGEVGVAAEVDKAGEPIAAADPAEAEGEPIARKETGAAVEIKTQSNVSTETPDASAAASENVAPVSPTLPVQTAAPAQTAGPAQTRPAAATPHETQLLGSPWERAKEPLGTAAIEEFHGQDWCESLGARRADALKVLAERYLTELPARSGSSADRYQVVVHIDQALLAGSPALDDRADVDRADEDQEPRRLWDRCELENGAALAIETARRLACDGSLVGISENAEGEPLNVGRKTRSISPALSRALKSRDGGCRFPGCGRTYFTQGHHVKHWADGGETKLSNLITLCHFHHGLVHEGGFSVEATGDGGFVFRQPDGTRIEEGGPPGGIKRDYGLPVAYEGQAMLPLFAFNRARGLDIDADTSKLRWLGEHMDYGYTVAYMVRCRDRARESRELTAGRM
ncbi:MAG TPA: DUF222 domain-containing protein, partial [Gammaproteobacteria bacterium]|nr:DUF222 domain-containing protein [Gammaproteobacteria bacterium]